MCHDEFLSEKLENKIVFIMETEAEYSSRSSGSMQSDTGSNFGGDGIHPLCIWMSGLGSLFVWTI